MERAHSLRTALILAAFAAIAGCTKSSGGGGPGGGGGTVEPVRPDEGPVVTVVSGGPVDALGVDRSTIDLPALPVRLSVANGRLVVGTASGVFQSDEVSSHQLLAMAVNAQPDEPTTTGPVRFISRRGNGGVLVAAESGLFHDLEGELLLSPLSQSLPSRPSSVDALGVMANEELWLVPEDASSNPRVLQVAAGELWTVRLSNVAGAPEAAVAVAPGLGLIAQGGDLFEVDLNASTAKVVAEELGSVHGFDRAKDGTLFLATDEGLLVRATDGTMSLHTLSAEGTEPVRALALFVDAEGAALISTQDAVLQLPSMPGSKPLRIASRAVGPAAISQIAKDGNGDTWTVDDGALVKLGTGVVVSFETDVKPFFAAHCTSCHDVGGTGPSIDFADLETVRARSPNIVKRLQADGASPMPPQSTEVLSPSDYAIVLRWVAGGMKP